MSVKTNKSYTGLSSALDSCLEDIIEVMEFLTTKIIESKNKAASVLIDSNNDHAEYLSVTMPSLKKRKTHSTKNY